MKSFTLLAVLGLGLGVSGVLGRAIPAPNTLLETRDVDNVKRDVDTTSTAEWGNDLGGFFKRDVGTISTTDDEDCGGCDFYVKRDVDTTSTAEWGNDLGGFFKRDVDTTSTAEWGNDLGGFFKRDDETTSTTDVEDCGGCDFYV